MSFRNGLCIEETERAWAAGFFEGEGNIYRDATKRATYRISVGQTGEEQVELRRFLAITGCGKIQAHKQSKYPNAKPMFSWRCNQRKQIQHVADLLIPYMCGPKLAQFEAFLLEVGTLCASSGHWRRCYKYKHGLVIGKMYPYHRGHKRLIDYAAKHSEHLDVIIVDRDKPGDYEGIPITTRVEWVIAGTDARNVTVHVLKPPDGFPEVDDKKWAKLTKKVLGYYPTALFSHEHARDHGYAKRMDDCKFVTPPDEAPVRATMIREDPARYYEYLDPVVRAYYESLVD